MTKVDHIRTTGKRLCYRIEADPWGWFTVWLGDVMLLRGHDRLSAHGIHRAPNRRKEAGAVAAARAAIESLREMDET